MTSKRLYCYVDETSQDSLGDIFIVSVVVPENRDELLDYLIELEIKTGRGKVKWGRASQEKRLNFLEQILNQRKHYLEIYYSVYKDTKEYKQATILTIAKSINAIRNFKNKLFTILVDGLGEKDQRYYGSQLRHLGIPSRKIRGVKKDENNALIRLADSICGFVRDVREDEEEKAVKIYKKAIQDKGLVEV